MVMGYRNNITLALAAASANNIAQSQSPAAGAITLNGSTVVSGVAILDAARRVIITSGGNDSGITFTVIGTDRYGRAQSETVTGANAGIATTIRDFLTVSSVTHTGSIAGTVTVGTSAVGSTQPFIMDTMTSPFALGIACVVVSGSPTYTVEISNDDMSPSWDTSATLPTWFAASGFSAQTTSQIGSVLFPVTMVRLTNNSGTGSTSMKLTQGLGAGGF